MKNISLRLGPAPKGLVMASILALPQLFAVDAVTQWNKVATDATAAAGIDPLEEVRVLSIVHIAIHDAVNALDRRFEPYIFRQSIPGPAPEVAVASAAREVLLALVPGQKSAIETAYTSAVAAVPSENARASAVSTGRLAARRILSERADDGSATVVEVSSGTNPGEWRPTPPGFFPAFKAAWGKVRPFGLRSSSQFRPDPPFDVNSPEFNSAHEEVRVIGADASPVRTEEQSAIARFWYENSGQGWNRIARTVAEQKNLNTWDNARLFALLNVAMSDGYVANFEAKYYYNYWRPVTAIREGDADGNPDTVGDRNWTSYLVTPPVPDYPSGHSTVGSAAARVLEHAFANDFVSFTTTSGAPYAGITRHFWSFSEAAHENAASRVLAGIHFWHASRGGIRQGEQIADYVFANIFRRGR